MSVVEFIIFIRDKNRKSVFVIAPDPKRAAVTANNILPVGGGSRIGGG